MIQKVDTTRGALGLYGALLVLPTLVFGWLYWRELQKDYQTQLDAVPASARDGARRIAALMRDRLDDLIEVEEERPFYHYATLFSPEDALSEELALQPSPLVKARAPRGVLGWFTFDRLQGEDGEIDLFLDRNQLAEDRASMEADLRPALERFRIRKLNEDRLLQYPQLDGVAPRPLPLRALATHLGHKTELECLRVCSPVITGSLSTGISKFRLDFYLDDDGTPRAIASRQVYPAERLHDLPEQAACLEPLLDGFHLHQGLLIDVGWLFQELPFLVAGQALGETEGELVRPEATLPLGLIDSVFADVLPVRDLGFATVDDGLKSYGKLEVSIDTDHIDARYWSHLKRFLGVGLMLVLSLATGFTLLYRSVNSELEQAHRTQNFVASVTHELRTPLSTIQLHGEMLMDGWVEDPEKRHEYYRRIVRETKRLSTLVERVLEKSQLKEKKVEPAPAALNAVIERMRPTLASASDVEDLRFELQQDLPQAWITTEAVTGIVSNLVENARKYAPVTPGAEPILIRTHKGAEGGPRVVLEVADRGPGVPPEEIDKIFEAFYRVGSEATRTATGTGLGLHLVQLHAEATGAKASVHPRDGGGSVFRVAFRAAS